jgi:hypothetical protein
VRAQAQQSGRQPRTEASAEHDTSRGREVDAPDL